MNVKQLKDKEGNDIQPNSPDKVGYFDPSTYISFVPGTDYDVPNDGWLCVGGGFTPGGTGTILLKINGKSFGIMALGSNSGYISSFYWVPVKKSDVVAVYSNSGSPTWEVYGKYFPLRTNLENGGGEFDTISILTTSYIGREVVA